MRVLLLNGLLALLFVFGSVPVYADTRPAGLFDTVTKAENANGAQTDNELWAPATGKRIVLMGFVGSSDAATNIQLESSNTDVIPPLYISTAAGETSTPSVGFGSYPLWVGAENATLDWTSTGSDNASVLAVGYEED